MGWDQHKVWVETSTKVVGFRAYTWITLILIWKQNHNSISVSLHVYLHTRVVHAKLDTYLLIRMCMSINIYVNDKCLNVNVRPLATDWIPSLPFHSYQIVSEYLTGQHFDWLDDGIRPILELFHFFVIKVMDWLLFYAKVTISKAYH